MKRWVLVALMLLCLSPAAEAGLFRRGGCRPVRSVACITYNTATLPIRVVGNVICNGSVCSPP